MSRMLFDIHDDLHERRRSRPMKIKRNTGFATEKLAFGLYRATQLGDRLELDQFR